MKQTLTSTRYVVNILRAPFLMASIPSSAVISGVVLTALTASPGEEVMEEAVAVTLSGIWQITTTVLILNHLLYTVKSPDGRPFGFTIQKALWGKPTLRALAVGIQARDLSVLAFSITLIPERISMRRDAPPSFSLPWSLKGQL